MALVAIGGLFGSLFALCPNIVGTHQPGNPVFTTAEASRHQLGMYSRVAISLATFLMNGLDFIHQFVGSHLSLTGHPPAPGIVATRRYFQNLAHPMNRELVPMVTNELKFLPSLNLQRGGLKTPPCSSSSAICISRTAQLVKRLQRIPFACSPKGGAIQPFVPPGVAMALTNPSTKWS